GSPGKLAPLRRSRFVGRIRYLEYREQCTLSQSTSTRKMTMNFNCWWKRLWTIHGGSGQVGMLIPKDCTFWLEPVYANGQFIHCTLHPESGVHTCLSNLTLYPVGWKD